MDYIERLGRAKNELYLQRTKIKGKGPINYAKPKDNPKSHGVPIPSARNEDWFEYIAEYDPFNWSGKYAKSIKRSA